MGATRLGTVRALEAIAEWPRTVAPARVDSAVSSGVHPIVFGLDSLYVLCESGVCSRALVGRE